MPELIKSLGWSSSVSLKNKSTLVERKGHLTLLNLKETNTILFSTASDLGAAF